MNNPNYAKKIIYFGKILILLFFILLTGCMSSNVHTGGIGYRVYRYDPRLDSPSPIYGGTVKDFARMGHQISSPITSIYKENVHWYEIFYFPVILIDTPLSFISDTIYLPSDIKFWSKWKNRKQIKEKYFKDIDKFNTQRINHIPTKEDGVWEEVIIE